jgi:gamma-glutamyltranspeptidase/glutathione hydrolase
MIQSIYFGFGSGFTAGDTGVVLHNRGHHFSLAEGHTNRLEPGKRTLHTLMASMALRNGRPWLVFGTMGADGQPQGTVQVLEQILRGASPQRAVAAPRVLSGRFHPDDSDIPLHVEEDLGADVIDELAARGHEISIVPPKDARLGHAHAILVDGGKRLAGVDPRSDGLEG